MQTIFVKAVKCSTNMWNCCLKKWTKFIDSPWSRPSDCSFARRWWRPIWTSKLQKLEQLLNWKWWPFSPLFIFECRWCCGQLRRSAAKDCYMEQMGSQGWCKLRTQLLPGYISTTPLHLRSSTISSLTIAIFIKPPVIRLFFFLSPLGKCWLPCHARWRIDGNDGYLHVGCRDMGFKSYKLRSRDDLSNPFLAMYFGAAYVCWLTTYSGRYQSDHPLTSSSILLQLL